MGPQPVSEPFSGKKFASCVALETPYSAIEVKAPHPLTPRSYPRSDDTGPPSGPRSASLYTHLPDLNPRTQERYALPKLPTHPRRNPTFVRSGFCGTNSASSPVHCALSQCAKCGETGHYPTPPRFVFADARGPDSTGTRSAGFCSAKIPDCFLCADASQRLFERGDRDGALHAEQQLRQAAGHRLRAVSAAG